MPIGETRLRIRVFSILAAVAMVIVGGKAVFLQGIDSSAYAATAAEKMRYTQDLAAARGTITDRNGVVLATTEPAMIVSIDPIIVRTNGADERYPMTKKKIEEKEAAPNAVAKPAAR